MRPGDGNRWPDNVEPMTDLFAGSGSDPEFLAVKSNQCFADVRNECERLWAIFHPLADPNFVDQFSRDFRARFWELYIGSFLRERHQAVKAVKAGSAGPDFKVPGPPAIFVEATNASRGSGPDSVPRYSGNDEDDSRVPFEECVLRITSKLNSKALSNNARLLGSEHPYIIAVNLPFPEAWVASNPPLAAQATLGVGSLLIVQESSEAWKTVAAPRPLQDKRSGSAIKTTSFCTTQFEHIAALVVASVNPFSSSYADPAIEVLHNPRATTPLPRGWLGLGAEYWVEGGILSRAP